MWAWTASSPPGRALCLSRDHPIVVVAAPGRERESLLRLGRIGFDHVVGYLQDGMLGLHTRPDLTTVTLRLSAPFAAERLASAAPPQLLDVRAPREHEAKSIPGSVHIPLTHLTERLAELSPDRPVLVHCAGGYRSSVAASLLQRHGFTDVSEIAGGLAAWEAAGLPVVKP